LRLFACWLKISFELECAKMPTQIGPYQVEFELTGWQSPSRDHVIRHNVIALGNPAAGSLATAINFQKKGGGTGTMSVLVNQLWEFYRLFWNNSISCSGVTLWKVVEGTNGKDFISTMNVTNPLCSGGAGQVAAQLTQTFRGGNGGIMKIVLLESNQSGTTRVSLVPNPAGNSSQRLAAFVLSVDGFMIAGDDSFPVAALRDSRGENEKLFRQVYR
jgi:hypothetical protein